MKPRKRIMIVDDEPNVRLVFRTALEATGYQVVEAGDGEAALQQLGLVPADLILLDLKMPGTSGLETLERLREAGDETPVVVITAHGRIPDAVAVMKLGAVDFLPKPVSPITLRAVTARACEQVAARRMPDRQPPANPDPQALFEENLSWSRQAIEHRDFDDADFFLRIAETLRPGSPQVDRLRQALRSCRLHPEAFSFSALGEMLH